MSNQTSTWCGMPFDVIPVVDGGRIIRLKNVVGAGYEWPNRQLANHNIFRLGPNNEVIWQVRRVENGFVNWESRNRNAKEEDPNSRGYLDPFWGMGLDDRAAVNPEPKGVYRPGCVIGMHTRWWEYTLDPETGIATCTGQQLK